MIVVSDVSSDSDITRSNRKLSDHILYVVDTRERNNRSSNLIVPIGCSRVNLEVAELNANAII